MTLISPSSLVFGSKGSTLSFVSLSFLYSPSDHFLHREASEMSLGSDGTRLIATAMQVSLNARSFSPFGRGADSLTIQRCQDAIEEGGAT